MPSGAAHATEKKKILIADDSQLNRDMLSEMLGDAYDYLYAEDGEHLLSLLSESVEADLLLLDMHMPKMNGMDVLKVMNANHWTDELPVVIISAENDVGFIRNACQLGAIDYVQRPFDAFMVQHRVESILSVYTRNKRLVRLVENQVLQRETVNNTLLNILSRVLETINFESGNHTLRVQRITSLLLKRLVRLTDQYALTEEDIAMISSVSALHDIGKIAVPDAVLNKPGALTIEEWTLMKSHTVKGDEMLWGLPVDQGEKMMVLAHEICRHHHERYDGSGYPDGLRGDEIPISAQAVSVADVYDALTSNRCYKKAFTHEQAVEMIVNGECGSFNPLLVRCFKEISDDLFTEMNWNVSETNYMSKIQSLADEALEKENLPSKDRAGFIAECDRAKKEFFSEQCGGIQFEYDAVTRKVLTIFRYDADGRRISLPNTATHLLELKDWVLLQEKVRQSTRENPTVTMTALIPLNDVPRWYRVTARSIWVEGSSSYVAVVGCFENIHAEMVRKGKDLFVGETRITGDTLNAMRSVFNEVRLVDPTTCDVLNLREDGSVVRSETKCYALWNCTENCRNCTSAKALHSPNWLSKLAVRDGRIYSVLSRSAKCGGADCVLEVALCMEDMAAKHSGSVGFLPDSATLQGYYRDTLTGAYSRAYFDSFCGSLEHAKGVAVVDANQIRSINDAYGHIAGDAALKCLAAAIRSCIRENDVLIRYGGDEFLLLFLDIESGAFFETLEKIKRAASALALPEYPGMQLSVSVGGAYGVAPLSRAIAAADKAMYRDKFQVEE